ncbi:hypothetical protein SRB5_01420 [Streptomyces sp. RB5]|uniref:TetR family transcriptional regulator n=1 Tax=Streptomyces smaragdinus TaxID=2585196 RepID=A0A7K0C9E2_9ACTN|nr:TetR family transcriptional regulator [Streptomyces smaragdinus]MQY10038.1 hypothetical protein [Streptomyces smaragdinus]
MSGDNQGAQAQCTAARDVPVPSVEPGGEALVVAHLYEADRAIRDRVDAAVAAGLPAADAIRTISTSIVRGIRSPGFHGSVFLDAIAEYSDPGHPVHRAVLAHRRWFLDTATGLLGGIPELPAEPAARHFVMMCDGAMTAGRLFGPEAVCDDFLLGVEGLLTGELVSF